MNDIDDNANVRIVYSIKGNPHVQHKALNLLKNIFINYTYMCMMAEQHEWKVFYLCLPEKPQKSGKRRREVSERKKSCKF
jgi:hypothetical protein